MRRKKPAGQPKGSAQKVDWKALEIVHPDAAGIDVGGSEHWVAIRPERDAEPVRRFGCFTADLRELAQWLVQKGVHSVALQSTGGVLDAGVGDAGAAWPGSVFSECAAHQERART